MNIAVSSQKKSETARRVRRAVLFVVSLLLVAAAWEIYKVVGPEAGGKIFGWKLLPRSNNNAMPHVWDMLTRYNLPELRGSEIGRAHV